MDFKHWLKGLLAATIGGAATTVGAMSGAAATGSPLAGKQIAGAAVGGAITGMVMYLKQSPIPPDNSAGEK